MDKTQIDTQSFVRGARVPIARRGLSLVWNSGTASFIVGGALLWASFEWSGGGSIYYDSSVQSAENRAAGLQILMSFVGMLLMLGGSSWSIWKLTQFHVRDEAIALGKADALEESATQEESLVGYVLVLLAAAAERQHAGVLTAERRAGNLFRIGTFLMALSVFVPFVLFFVYVNTDPSTTVKQLAAEGVPVVEAVRAAQRDWHLLVAGISFGLLFIAAARGILLAELRQREVYNREVRETAYYGDLTRALKIAQRLDASRGDTNDRNTEVVVRKILALFLQRGAWEHAPASIGVSTNVEEPTDHEFIEIMMDAFKR